MRAVLYQRNLLLNGEPFYRTINVFAEIEVAVTDGKPPVFVETPVPVSMEAYLSHSEDPFPELKTRLWKLRGVVHTYQNGGNIEELTAIYHEINR